MCFLFVLPFQAAWRRDEVFSLRNRTSNVSPESVDKLLTATFQCLISGSSCRSCFIDVRSVALFVRSQTLFPPIDPSHPVLGLPCVLLSFQSCPCVCPIASPIGCVPLRSASFGSHKPAAPLLMPQLTAIAETGGISMSQALTLCRQVPGSRSRRSLFFCCCCCPLCPQSRFLGHSPNPQFDCFCQQKSLVTRVRKTINRSAVPGLVFRLCMRLCAKHERGTSQQHR